MKRPALQYSAAVGWVVVVLSCSSDAQRRSAPVTVRDSAGVEILTFAPGPFADTINPEPLFTIGKEGDPDYEFFRIATVVSLGTGTVVVANGGTSELRIFDGNGQHLNTTGGPGEGPSEFGFLTTVWVRPGDTLAVHDPRRRRIVYFDSTGTFARGESFASDLTTEAPAASGPCFFPGLMGLLADGTRLTLGWGCMPLEGHDGRRSVVQELSLVSADGEVGIGSFNGGWIWERGSPNNPANFYSLIPFTGALRTAVGADRVFVSEGENLEISVYGSHGGLVTLVREDSAPAAVTDADRDAYRAERIALDRPHPSDVPFPDRFGSYARLVLSYEGDLWAQRVPRPVDENQHWVVFSADGGSVRRVVMPDLQVGSVRDGRIYGYRTDDLGIQTVVVLDAGE